MKSAKDRIVGVTAFKAKCLGLVQDVASGKIKRVVLTKHGRPVAELVRPKPAAGKTGRNPFGALAGLMAIDPSVDLTEPSGLVFDAEGGIAFNE